MNIAEFYDLLSLDIKHFIDLLGSDIIYVCDLIGTFVFAISGTLAAARKKLDLFGALFAASITAFGGGTIRDTLLGATPVFWTIDMAYIAVITLAVILTFIFKNSVMKLKKTLFLFDTIGIGVFTIIGLEKTLALGFHPIVAVMMGVSTAVFGGVLRDTFVNDVPVIFRKEIYATACILGSGLFLILYAFDCDRSVNIVLTILVIIAVRFSAIYFRVQLPTISSGQRRRKRIHKKALKRTKE
ncbi:trimeric intracellular cation channel family protein [Marinilabiliaceae bacterium JC040]|nr:trimeric intracellular cation channel family protein [Marinilabiliaceae bacterium JC040]